MSGLQVPRVELLEELFTAVAAENQALLASCRWLVLGPRLGAIVAPDDSPSLEDLKALLRILRSKAPELLEVGQALVRNSEHGEDAFVEICVDRLLEASDWHHPIEVLERPRPDFGKLLDACRARQETASGDHVASTLEKLERAVSIAESARIRRERMRRGRRRRC